MTTHSPTTLLRAAEMVHNKGVMNFSQRDDGRIMYARPYDLEWKEFNPHDPTKGDLAALNEALERAGWEFNYFDPADFFYAKHYRYGEVSAPTPAERAIRCVEAMP